MIRLLIGHRGTGKSSLLSRLKVYFGSAFEYYDLDLEIEKSSQRKISEIFETSGENFFRDIEIQTLNSILNKCSENTYIVLGAGFDLQLLKTYVHKTEVWWVSRETDLEGRIFVDRPRLDVNKDPLTEFLDRAQKRENVYKEFAHRTYVLPEGEIRLNSQAAAIEKSLFAQNWQNTNWIVTLLPDFNKAQLSDYLRGSLQIELRDDFLADTTILDILGSYPQNKFIFSFRRSRTDLSFWKSDFFKELLRRVHYLDWAWELGEPKEFLHHVPKNQRILSLHQQMSEEFQKVAPQASIAKWAPLIESWQDLESAYEWKENHEHCVLLPRSNNGRWKWFRLYSYYHQEINFIREGVGSAIDQPTFSEAFALHSQKSYFAAVLGDPVRHSYSPLEHREDFFNRKAPFLSIQISKPEFARAFRFLKHLGLRAAAVTSPLKEEAAKVCQTSLGAVNTLWIGKSNIEGISTDDIGFEALITDLKSKLNPHDIVVVWGGGGTLEVLKKSLPQAQFYSSSRSTPRLGSESVQVVKALIWAAPRMEGTMMPPVIWKPQWIYDLNYKEDSLGREYAQMCGAQYISGLKMFKAQADAQRLYWKKKTGELK